MAGAERPGREWRRSRPARGRARSCSRRVGREHEVVTPDPEEERRIRNACDERGIDAARVTFHIGRSHDVLPDLPVRALDLALVDGAHGFPYPVLDWWYLAPA